MNMVRASPLPSPTPDRRQRRREARSEAIVEIAMSLVGEKGLEGLTLHEIATQLDCAIGALYRYFPSKGALLAELQRRVVVVVHDKLSACRRSCGRWAAANPSNSKLTALMPVVAVALLYEALACSAPAQFGMLSLSLGDPRRLIDDANARLVAEASGPMFADIAGDLAAAGRGGALKLDPPNDNALANAMLLWAALHGVVQLRKLEELDPRREPTAAAALRLVRSVLVGWGANPLLVDEATATLNRELAPELSMSAADFAIAPLPSILDVSSPGQDRDSQPREQ